MGADEALEELLQVDVEVARHRLDLVGDRVHGLRHDRVQHHLVHRAVVRRAGRAELELVAREGERRRTVAVGVVDEQLRDFGDVHLVSLLASHGEEIVGIRSLDVVEQFGELLAEERRDDCGRSLVGTQTMSICCAHDRGLEQSVVTIYTHQSLDDEGDETEVVLRSLARSMEHSA